MAHLLAFQQGILGLSAAEWSTLIASLAVLTSIAALWRVRTIERQVKTGLRSQQVQSINAQWQAVNRMVVNDQQFAGLVQELFGRESDEDAKLTAAQFVFLGILSGIHDAWRNRLLDEAHYNANMGHFFDSYKLPLDLLWRTLERGNFPEAFKQECRKFASARSQGTRKD